MTYNPIEEIVVEVKSLMLEAYNNGVKDGIDKQQTLNAKLEDPRIILRDFISYISKFKLTYVDGEYRYSDENYVYSDESFIKTFIQRDLQELGHQISAPLVAMSSLIARSTLRNTSVASASEALPRGLNSSTSGPDLARGPVAALKLTSTPPGVSSKWTV